MVSLLLFVVCCVRCEFLLVDVSCCMLLLIGCCLLSVVGYMWWSLVASCFFFYVVRSVVLGVDCLVVIDECLLCVV